MTTTKVAFFRHVDNSYHEQRKDRKLTTKLYHEFPVVIWKLIKTFALFYYAYFKKKQLSTFTSYEKQITYHREMIATQYFIIAFINNNMATGCIGTQPIYHCNYPI